MKFSTIHTAYGLSQLSAAEASGIPINLTHMAIGDGNGNEVTPSESQATLVREVFRTTVNRVYQSPDDEALFTAEMIIPASAGGFTMREVGVFDANGSLFVVGNLPETYKPTDGDGAYSDTIVRVEFKVGNASTVTVQIDPNVAVATQTWITNNITAAFLLPGGTTHQVLRKKSNTDGDTEWADQTAVSVYVDMVEETQTLAVSQTIVDWATVTNTGLAIYIDGVRLRGDQWTPDSSINTRVTLAQPYPDGTKITGVQNEPANSLPDPLVKDQSLADVPDKSEARRNLDVFSKAETRQMAPAGSVVAFARKTAPAGWLKANGAAVSRTAYADLFAAIGTSFGIGDGFNTFNLPDLRGEFIRGWDDGRGADSGRVFGSSQRGTVVSFDTNTTDNIISGAAGLVSTSSQTNESIDADNISGGSSYTTCVSPQTTLSKQINYGVGRARPRNIALLTCIKY